MQPTLHFFQNGKKAGEVIGADVQRLKDTMEALYKWKQTWFPMCLISIQELLNLEQIYHIAQ